MSPIAEGLRQVRARIDRAMETYHRVPGSVRLIAVSKHMPAAAIREAYALGQRDFGENYVQELKQKADELSDLPNLRLHLIGHLQSNKVKAVVGVVSMIQSIDSRKLVNELSRRVSLPSIQTSKAWPLVFDVAHTGGCAGSAKASPDVLPLPVLIEVNIAGEAQKSGCLPDELPAILDAIDAAPNLFAAGLMTVPPFTENAVDARPHFEHLRALRERLGGASRLPELSMGMTLDLEEAIAAGATLLRVGTAIFGSRTAPETRPPTSGET